MGLNLSIGVLCLSIVISSSEMVIEPTQAQVLNITAGSASANKLSIVKNRIDLMRLSGQEVKLVGYYVSQSWKPGINANTVEFKGEYHVSQIVLEDGTSISIFPPGQKQSLRSSDEATTYQGKIVEAIGMIKFEEMSDKNSRSGGSFINLRQLKLVR
jgi:hypothetical protein